MTAPRHPPVDCRGRRLRKGDRVRVVGVPELHGMTRTALRETRPVFRHLVGTYRTIAGFDRFGFAELWFQIRSGPHRGRHWVAIEPGLLQSALLPALAKRKYQLVRVRVARAGRRLRYEILGPLWCSRMNGPIRNRGTYTLEDQVWRRIFGSREAAVAFWRSGRTLTRTMRLATLHYDDCDYALEPARRRR
jgi:hypothetical protein